MTMLTIVVVAVACYCYGVSHGRAEYKPEFGWKPDDGKWGQLR